MESCVNIVDKESPPGLSEEMSRSIRPWLLRVYTLDSGRGNFDYHPLTVTQRHQEILR